MTSSHPIFGPNKLKLGVFCMNTMSALTEARDLFVPAWNDCVTLARMADDAGLEAFVPIARWKGYVDGDFGHPSNYILEPFTFAAGIAQATKQIGVFATTHASMTHPLQVAKQAATIDMISGGRFAMNVVGGWNRREFEMFGIDLLGHEDRYVYLAEWLEIVRQLWSATDEIDVETRHFRLKGALSRPQPARGQVPIMNAGFSSTGMRFAAANSDIGLIGLFGDSEAAWADQIGRYKALARDEFGKEIQIWTNAPTIMRDTDAEAQALYRHYSEEMPDRIAIEGFVSTIARENKVGEDSDQMRFLRKNAVLGSGFPMIGAPATITEQLAALSRAGLDGVIMSFVDYIDGLHRFTRDVQPQLCAAGLRR
jgi:alkanesulfonate monooxygenase SsuD/methylene tetrahydromethanopterin reductase-like flavin-dependent oxidoreductase (luciferase family)